MRKKIVSIFLVDDHPLLREGLAARIGRETDLCVCGQAGDFDSALKQMAKLRPDVAVLDLSLAESHGLELIKAIRRRGLASSILVFSAYSELLLGKRALQLGAHGYVNKGRSHTSILEAIRRVAAGKRYLSEALKQQLLAEALQGKDAGSGVQALSTREMEVFELLGRGRATRAIARELGLSAHTVETYREKIRLKLGVDDSGQLLQRAVRWVIENR